MPVRPLIEGDRIPRREVQANVEHAGTQGMRSLPEAELPDGELPSDFIERVVALSASTIVHVPTRLRHRLASTMAATLLGMARGNGKASTLEQARSKLLLGPVPRFRSKRKVLTERFDAWEAGQFECLLIKAEEVQFALRRQAGVNRNTQDALSGKLRRAKQLVSNGAYSKAIAALSSELAVLTPGDEQKWVEELLPGSRFPDEALSESVDGMADRTETGSRDNTRHVLKGIRFGALSAAGPSGCRPEHLNDALSAQPRSTASRLLRAITEFNEVASVGGLADHCRWLLGSKLVFLRKKVGNKPRPIRIGEFWRRVVAKKLVQINAATSRKIFARARQFGISVPGGAEALIHFRTCLEDSLRTDDGPALAILDLDLRNAFPSLEWPSIRAGVEEFMPGISGWTRWCHSSKVFVELPCGTRVWKDRGAEQGDPLGAIYCGVTIASVIHVCREKNA